MVVSYYIWIFDLYVANGEGLCTIILVIVLLGWIFCHTFWGWYWRVATIQWDQQVGWLFALPASTICQFFLSFIHFWSGILLIVNLVLRQAVSNSILKIVQRALTCFILITVWNAQHFYSIWSCYREVHVQIVLADTLISD